MLEPDKYAILNAWPKSRADPFKRLLIHPTSKGHWRHSHGPDPGKAETFKTSPLPRKSGGHVCARQDRAQRAEGRELNLFQNKDVRKLQKRAARGSMGKHK